MGIFCSSLKKKTSEIELSDTNSVKIKSHDIDSEDKQIYGGNFENVPTITQSEIRIFLSSTFKGNLIKKTFKVSLI
jgi:hypothetical protein